MSIVGTSKTPPDGVGPRNHRLPLAPDGFHLPKMGSGILISPARDPRRRSVVSLRSIVTGAYVRLN